MNNKLLKRILDFFETRKKQKNCKHKDITIVAHAYPFYKLHCYDCNKTWEETDV